MRWIKGSGLALWLALLAVPAWGADYKAEYKVSTVVGKPFPWGLGAERWAELVGERSQGRIRMKVYPGAQLVQGDQTKELTAMRQGIVDMAVGSTINWSPQVKELNLFSLPFLMPDYAAIDALTHGKVGARLFDILRTRGVEPLAWGENGFRELSNSRRPVRLPEDLKGLKIRVVGSPLFNDIFTALGANPTQMSWADAQPALATGAVDGQENPLSIFTVAKLEDVGQKQLTLWHYVADPLIFAVSGKVWATFSAEDQKILAEAAKKAGAYCIQLARDGLTGDEAKVKEIEAQGVAVVRPTPEEHAAFVAATRPVFLKWKAQIGADLVDEAQAAIGR